MTEQGSALAVREQKTPSLAPRNFNEVAIAADRYAKSTLVPERFRGKPDDCFVAIQLAARQNVDPLMLMQHSYVVHGSPGIEGKYAIALMNAKGPFKGGVQFNYSGDGDSRVCEAWAIHRQTGQRCTAEVSIGMAKAEGWTKNTKWQTMRDQMLAYRAGAFLCRKYCPEVMMGMQTVEELEDIIDITPEPPARPLEATPAPQPVPAGVGLPSDEFEGVVLDMEAAFERKEGQSWWDGNKALYRSVTTPDQWNRLVSRAKELAEAAKEQAGARVADESPESPLAGASAVDSPAPDPRTRPVLSKPAGRMPNEVAALLDSLDKCEDQFARDVWLEENGRAVAEVRSNDWRGYIHRQVKGA